MSAGVFGERFGTRRGAIFVALVTASLAVLGVSALMGYEIAVKTVAALVGFGLGVLLARPIASRMEQSFVRRFDRWRDAAASALAAVLFFGILLVGITTIGLYPSLMSEGEPYRMLVFGLALGFGHSLRERLAPASRRTPDEVREARRKGLQILVVVGGAVVGIFAFAFAVYAAVEYVAGPVIRAFAP